MARRTHAEPCKLVVLDGEPGLVEDCYSHLDGALHESFARPETSDKLRSTDGLGAWLKILETTDVENLHRYLSLRRGTFQRRP